MRRGAACALLLVLVSATARADSNDLVMSRLATETTTGGMTRYIGENLEFRALCSQLGVVLAPHMLTPADSIGFGGFQLAVDTSYTQIDSSAAYWRVLESSTDPSATTDGTSHGAATQQTVGLFARKGMWFPIPSIEVGAGAIHLTNSRLWAGQLYAKFSLHEGYHDLPLPSFAVRGAVSRLMDQRELDLTVASIDVSISKHFGIGGTWRFDPYGGWNRLFIVPRGEVLDPTQNIDPLVPGNSMASFNNFVFRDQSDIIRDRIFIGMKMQYYVFQITLEAAYALAGTSTDNRGAASACQPSSTTADCNATDIAKAQTTYSLTAGFDF